MRRACSSALVAWCVAVSLARPDALQVGSNRLALTDIFNLEFAADPQVSPDGKRVVYVRHFSDIMSDRRRSSLWIVNFDGTGHRALTTGHFNDTSPRWASDGSRILFISDRHGSPQIHVLWTDTGQIAKLTNLQQAPRGLAWSPDGSQVAFAAFVPGPARAYANLPAPPAGAKWSAPARVIDQLIYRRSISGKGVYPIVGILEPGHTRQLFAMPAEGGTPRQISSGPYNHGDPVWTPDGKYLLASANRRPDDETHDRRGTEIYEFSVSDGTVRVLTQRKGPDTSPTISPDGEQIAYIGFDDEGLDYQLNRLYVMNRDGSGVRVLSQKLDRGVDRPRWAPDGSGVYFVYDDHGNTKLGLYSLDGRLTDLAADLGGTGRAGGGRVSYGAFSAARNGNFAFTYSRPHVPADIAVGRTGQPSVRVVTAVNQDLLGVKKLGEVEEIWYPSSLDGRKIQGWIVKPPDFDPSKKYPLILDIHGGPWGNYGPRFDMEKQLMAAHGYVVFYPNYRGSTSYGFDFGHLIEQVHPGIAGDDRNPGDVTHDLNSGVDAVIAKGYIDPNNLFVNGLSAGGSLTFWMIAHTDRFRAAVVQAPAGANWYSFVLYAGRPSLLKYRFPGVPWEHTDHYMKRSPITLIKNVKTPTMIVTGEEDDLTPMANSEEYYFALKWLKVETVLVRVPDEPHGINRHPSHHMEKVAYTLSWFDRHRAKVSSPPTAAGC